MISLDSNVFYSDLRAFAVQPWRPPFSLEWPVCLVWSNETGMYSRQTKSISLNSVNMLTGLNHGRHLWTAVSQTNEHVRMTGKDWYRPNAESVCIVTDNKCVTQLTSFSGTYWIIHNVSISSIHTAVYKISLRTECTSLAQLLRLYLLLMLLDVLVQFYENTN